MIFTLETFFFNTPLYSPIYVSKDDSKELLALFDGTRSRDFEGFNPVIKKDSTFIVLTDLIPNGVSSPFYKNGGNKTVIIKCKRTDDRFDFFIQWHPKDRILIKIGQFPSIADFHISEIKKYKKLLSKDKLSEFTRAIGLAANGVGIGSFVYLRRIFEHLILQAYSKALNGKSITETDFMSSRMDEKISLLSSFLPEFLVENNGIYSILSLGIHELDEKTCLAHFDTLRVGIEIILDEQLDELRKKVKIEDAKKKLKSIKGNIKKG